jgi:hypothetical protein
VKDVLTRIATIQHVVTDPSHRSSLGSRHVHTLPQSSKTHEKKECSLFPYAGTVTLRASFGRRRQTRRESSRL